MMITVTCPCCKGKKYLAVVEHDEVEGRTVLSHHQCQHCQGKGKVPSEVGDDERVVDGR